MLSCKETTKLVSENLDRDLSLRERIALKMHLSICSACRNLKQQMNVLRQATSFYTQEDVDTPKPPLDKKPDSESD